MINMSELTWQLFSEVLGRETILRIFLPDAIPECTPLENLAEAEVVVALHGLGGSSRQIPAFTQLEYLATKYQTVIILPEANRSFYLNYPERFSDFICEEMLEKLVQVFQFPAPHEARWNLIGVSMGGYGALKLASQYPDKFKKSCALSAALDYKILSEGSGEETFKLPSESNWPWPPSEGPYTWDISKQVTYCLLCGLDDPFYPANLAFRDYLTSKNAMVSSYFEAGSHTWPYWNKALQRALRFVRELPIDQLDF